MIERDHLPEQHLISMFVEVQRDGDTREDSPSNRSETLVTHIAATVAAIPLFLFQMAKLKCPISMYFSCRTEALKTDMRSTSNSEPGP